jgi:TetR/AcrR family transcriptional regulator, regulator of cefoperazone and chloramphenicol sensitivity
MTLTKNKKSSARDRIFQAALDIFAHQGARTATIREICLRAQVNLAAVHYYFGSKDKLYEAVCRYACGREPLFEIPSAGPADQLHAFIRQFLEKIMGPRHASQSGMIMGREMIEPSSVLPIIIKGLFRPRFDQLSKIVQSLLGPAADDHMVRRCALSIVGQCLYYRHARPVVSCLNPMQTYDSTGLDQLADHITAFSLGALKNISKTTARRGTPREPEAV